MIVHSPQGEIAAPPAPEIAPLPCHFRQLTLAHSSCAAARERHAKKTNNFSAAIHVMEVDLIAGFHNRQRQHIAGIVPLPIEDGEVWVWILSAGKEAIRQRLHDLAIDF